MPKIKTKETVRDVKVLDKLEVARQNINRKVVRTKDAVENTTDDGYVSPEEYTEAKLKSAAENTKDNAKRAAKRGADKAKKTIRKRRLKKKNEVAEPVGEHPPIQNEKTVPQHVQNRPTYRSPVKSIRQTEHTERTIKQTAKSTGKSSIKTARASIKTADRTAKATEKVAIKATKETAKTAQKTAAASAKAAKQAAQLSQKAVVATQKAVVAAGKAAATMAKAIAAAIKELIAAIAAGGWVAVVVIIVVALVALIVCSCFGIFLSSEDTGTGGQTMQAVVQEINQEYLKKIDDIKAKNSHDVLELSGARAVWPEVLSVYSVKTTTDATNPQDVVTMTDAKKQQLKDIFWAMNEVTQKVETVTEKVIVESDDGKGNIVEKEEEKSRTYLRITVTHKTANDMATQYVFNDDQKKQLTELLAQDASLWSAVLYGIYSDDAQIVAVALSQVGNVGGQPYWSWYGFGSRVEWCACFVSWCANQCGYIDNGICPKYAGCGNGVNWFKNHGQWMEGNENPSPGMIVFFDWDNKGDSGPQDGLADHTGIVEKVDDKYVYTIEGNSGDTCKQNKYAIGNKEILGYGMMMM